MKSNFNVARQQGFTLVELMVGMLVGLIVLSGVLYTLIVTIKSSRDILYSARLNQELAAITSVITGDIRRAGHWIQGTATTTPYTEMRTDFHVVSNACVLYSYDEDQDSLIQDDEYRGVRFQGNDLWLKVSGDTTNANNMTDCSVGNWQRISDENFMTITAATFTDSSLCKVNDVTAACPASVSTNEVASVREVTMAITAQVNNDNAWQASIEESIKIRNNFYVDP